MYYRIDVNGSYEYVEAKTREQAEALLAKMADDLKNYPDDSVKNEDVYSSIQEVSIDECIAEEELMRSLDLAHFYVQLHYDPNTLTIGEYGRLQKAIRDDPHTKWLMLKELNGLKRQYAFLEKTCNLQKMPAAVYKETAQKLLLAIGTPEYEQIATSICRKYGKEEIRRQAEQDKTCPRNDDDGVI